MENLEDAMTVQDFGGVHEIGNLVELEATLMRRYGDGVNGFWLSHGRENYPTISLMVRGDLSYLHYFPTEDHPGFTPTGEELEGSGPGSTTTFYIDSFQAPIEIANDAMVSFPTALRVAKEFFFSKELPRCIEWQEL
jgi:Immunity protein Imm1